MIMNCFCGIIKRRKILSLISSLDHSQRFSPCQISDTPWAGFEPLQTLNVIFLKDFVQWWLSLHYSTIISYNVTGQITVFFMCFSFFSFSSFPWCALSKKRGKLKYLGNYFHLVINFLSYILSPLFKKKQNP